jgi:hypothetical protein
MEEPHGGHQRELAVSTRFLAGAPEVVRGRDDGNGHFTLE